jgi:type IV secretory pathway VirB10-like protein
MYENKIIVLIIVIAILIIGVIAYIILRKPDEPAASDDNSKLKTAGAPAPAAETPATAPTPAAKPSAKMDKSNLVNLLAKSKGAGAKSAPSEPEPEQPPAEVQTPADDGAKSEDEIMQLMEDETADESAGDVEIPSTDSSDVSTSEPSASDESPETDAGNSQNTSEVKTQSVFCTTILPMGRQCRNKAGNSGKCQRHQG